MAPLRLLALALGPPRTSGRPVDLPPVLELRDPASSLDPEDAHATDLGLSSMTLSPTAVLALQVALDLGEQVAVLPADPHRRKVKPLDRPEETFNSAASSLLVSQGSLTPGPPLSDCPRRSHEPRRHLEEGLGPQSLRRGWPTEWKLRAENLESLRCRPAVVSDPIRIGEIGRVVHDEI